MTRGLGEARTVPCWSPQPGTFPWCPWVSSTRWEALEDWVCSSGVSHGDQPGLSTELGLSEGGKRVVPQWPPHTSEEWQRSTSWDSLAPGRGFSGSEGVHLIPGLCGCPQLRWNPGSGPPHCHQPPLRALEILVASEASLAASQGSLPCSLDQEPAPRAWGEAGSSGLAASRHTIPRRSPGGPHSAPLISVGRFN